MKTEAMRPIRWAPFAAGGDDQCHQCRCDEIFVDFEVSGDIFGDYAELIDFHAVDAEQKACDFWNPRVFVGFLQEIHGAAAIAAFAIWNAIDHA